jgi:hypothetical protein
VRHKRVQFTFSLMMVRHRRLYRRDGRLMVSQESVETYLPVQGGGGVGAGNSIRQIYTTRKTKAQNYSYAVQ